MHREGGTTPLLPKTDPANFSWLESNGFWLSVDDFGHAASCSETGGTHVGDLCRDGCRTHTHAPRRSHALYPAAPATPTASGNQGGSVFTCSTIRPPIRVTRSTVKHSGNCSEQWSPLSFCLSSLPSFLSPFCFPFCSECPPFSQSFKSYTFFKVRE